MKMVQFHVVELIFLGSGHVMLSIITVIVSCLIQEPFSGVRLDPGTSKCVHYVFPCTWWHNVCTMYSPVHGHDGGIMCALCIPLYMVV